ncbi:hypothetical protein BK138_16060 [Paenibacillus rhizosphaerae]|uniref:Uncharacterized protein n=1 Tax=Paenibacillus rhizosphaerae TaxID=297318 RepID=A0A1R1ESG4_9BACL|nr:hypothetical protein [Paenibacillus rhizosphaerae]OMF54672.1 hypothetical protein BK138_16060 [Paenibacillus rhizosphaerae]
MAYTPTEWKNREVERPRTYNFQNNDDGTTTLIPAEGTIVEPGTPIVAANMNNIEQGLVDLSQNKADLESPVFTGTPKVGSDVIVTSKNITDYAKPPVNFDGSTTDKTLTVGPGKMFTTIQAAIDSLPAWRGYYTVINIDAGTYAGFTISNKHGGKIQINGNAAGVFISSDITVSNCTSPIGFYQFTSNSSASNLMNIDNCRYVELYKVNKPGGANGIVMNRTDYVYVFTCTISNIEAFVFNLRGGGTLLAENCTGANTYCVYSVTAAIAYDKSSGLTATNRILKSNGGQVFA